MKPILFNEDKNNRLIKVRNISFEHIIEKLVNEDIVNIISHHNNQKYSKQQIFIIKLDDYIYLVPFIEEDSYIFLKTIIPSRKYTKKYLHT